MVYSRIFFVISNYNFIVDLSNVAELLLNLMVSAVTMSTVDLGSDLQRSISDLLICEEQHDIMRQRIERNDQENRASNSNETEANTPNPTRSICSHFIEDMNKFGIAVLDSFLGNERGDLVYEEVINLHRAGLFTDGQLVRNETKNKHIRGDEIIWLVGNEEGCPHISGLINDIDKLVKGACRYANNGKLGKYKIDGRTKAMVACYPGNGAHYVKHVDNPHKDGRVLTAIYYLNKNWDSKVHGGMLRIFPTEERQQAAAIDPIFDRMLFFWSDRRNPHEVQPSFRTRYAITIWYFDSVERNSYEYRMHECSEEEKRTRFIQSSTEQEITNNQLFIDTLKPDL